MGVLVPGPGLRPVAEGETIGRHEVLILSSAIHTDFALPAEPEVLRRFAFLAKAGLPIERPDVASIVVGWGGRSFYLETPTWSELKPGPLFRALTLDSSVMHVALAGRIDPAAPGVRALTLDDAAFEALLAFVEASFAPDAEGEKRLARDTGYGAFDRFYEAKGRFNALAGCNVWTSAALRAAGIPTGLWTPLPVTLGWSLDWHG